MQNQQAPEHYAAGWRKIKLQATPLRRGRDRYFQQGASLGGPVVLPHLYDGHNRTFFFVNYDRTLRLTPNTVTETVPTLSQRAGDFSAVSATTPIINPATGKQFANNQVTGCLLREPDCRMQVMTPGDKRDPNASAVMNLQVSQTPNSYRKSAPALKNHLEPSGGQSES